MSDLCERLRSLVVLDEVGSNNPLGREAADEIASLRAQLAARPAPTRKEIAQTIWIKWRGYNPSNDQLENSTTGHEFLAIADAILALFAQSDEQ